MNTFTLYTRPVPLNQKFFVRHGRNILSSKYRDAKEALEWEIQSQWKEGVLEGDIRVEIHEYFGDKRRRDVDAYIKILLDAMEGICYVDDVQILDLHVKKSYDKENPRVEVSINKVVGVQC